MKTTKENIEGIMSVISLLQRKYPAFFREDYIEHYITENYKYLVVLTNNSTIQIHKIVAQDAEKCISSVTDESLERIIKTFKKN